mgnify:FL=1
MKVRFYIKDPDGFYYGAEQAAKKVVSDITGGDPTVLSDNEKDAIITSRIDAIQDKMEAWAEFGECIMLELDMDTGDLAVLPKNKW